MADILRSKDGGRRMTVKEIIDGLKFTVDMFLFDPTTGETYKEPRNDMDKITIDACKGAIELLEQTRWIPVSKKLPEENIHVLCQFYMGGMAECYHAHGAWHIVGGYRISCDEVLAWMPLPEPYKVEGSESECQG